MPSLGKGDVLILDIQIMQKRRSDGVPFWEQALGACAAHPAHISHPQRDSVREGVWVPE